jgi:hypothetical protein
VVEASNLVVEASNLVVEASNLVVEASNQVALACWSNFLVQTLERACFYFLRVEL